jgi:cell division septum initiation protein DivIVA
MQALDELNKKLTKLIKRHSTLEAENKRLRETIARQQSTEADLKQRIASLEQGMVSVNLDQTIGSAEERDNMRRQLDVLISEIDGILNTLND